MQLNKILDKYEIELKYPEKLTYFNGWLSGFFDADGSITLNKSNGQLAINLSQKTNELLLPLVELYGGSVYIDRTNNTFKWYISNKEGILNILEYLKKNTPKSMKKK
jgi:DNA-binding transcriptional regulator WhiA